MNPKITKIAVFYDGAYFFHVSNFYAFQHPRRERISIGGLHESIRRLVATEEGVDLKFCQIIESHYFRGRYPANAIENKDSLLKERIFNDVLMHNGVSTHFWPMLDNTEKAVDVALALEAYELARLKHLDVCVLIAGDGDYVPLLRKLHALGTRVMVCGWNFEFFDDKGQKKETHVSKLLLSEATYPMRMSEYFETLFEKKHPSLDALFVARQAYEEDEGFEFEAIEESEEFQGQVEIGKKNELFTGTIVLLNQGWGFIKPDDDEVDIFFHYGDLVDLTFQELKHGDRVEFTKGANERGSLAKTIKRII